MRHRCKLTEAQKAQIRKDYFGGHKTGPEIRAEYKISATTLSKVTYYAKAASRKAA